ncbi:GntR family transcriptional regulator [uncultured Sphaerochaeta sp.]|uniref:GntR family transcriptional regulator n=1 Tax=uncultured Sphaerochaeta sp. TaxID=886478 RepID=UPI002A0A79DB|nr:GntR family transcriptional regulator [uncultured Sphaerochaeta sp.]
MNHEKIQTTTVADSVYLRIKNAIIIGELKAGEHLVQEELTKDFGVSRTPVRDAFRRLESEGLVVNKPYYGATVFRPSKEQVLEIYEIRILIEQYCASRASKVATDDELKSIKSINDRMSKVSPTSKEYMQLDFEFHKRIGELSGCTNSTLEILEGLLNKSSSFKSIYYSMVGGSQATIAMHSDIVEALFNRDEEAVKKAIADHLNHVLNRVISSNILV